MRDDGKHHDVHQAAIERKAMKRNRVFVGAVENHVANDTGKQTDIHPTASVSHPAEEYTLTTRLMAVRMTGTLI